MDQTDTRVAMVRYEALRADLVTHFSAALAFMGRFATADDIARAIRHADFSELQLQESEKGFAERQSHNALFFRSGRVGAWQDVLTGEQVAAIEHSHGSFMTQLGYEISA